MYQLHRFPKTIKKTIRYILQDADGEMLKEIEKVLSKAVYTRQQELADQKNLVNGESD